MENNNGDLLQIFALSYLIGAAIFYVLIKAAIKAVLQNRDDIKFNALKNEKNQLDDLVKKQKITLEEYNTRMLKLPTEIVHGKY